MQGEIIIGSFGVGVLISSLVQLAKLVANGAGWQAPSGFFGVLNAALVAVANLLVIFGPLWGIDLGAVGEFLRGVNEIVGILVVFAGAFVPYLLATRVQSNS